MLKRMILSAVLAAAACAGLPAHAQQDNAPQLTPDEIKTQKLFWAFNDCGRAKTEALNAAGARAAEVRRASDAATIAALKASGVSEEITNDVIEALHEAEGPFISNVLARESKIGAACMAELKIDPSQENAALRALVEKYGDGILERPEPEAAPALKPS